MIQNYSSKHFKQILQHKAWEKSKIKVIHEKAVKEEKRDSQDEKRDWDKNLKNTKREVKIIITITIMKKIMIMTIKNIQTMMIIMGIIIKIKKIF